MNHALYVIIIFVVVVFTVNYFFEIPIKIKTFVNLILLILFLVWVFQYSGVLNYK